MIGDTVFVVTHQPPTDWSRSHPGAPFTFVTNGLPSALDQALACADGRDVSLAAGNLAGQALAAGPDDEVAISLVPVVFGTGVRFFGGYAARHCCWTNPQTLEGDRVTHLHYRDARPGPKAEPL